MRRLAIIPARGRSKGLPGKNLASIAGETLVRRAVRCAREAAIFDAIIASTDCEVIVAEALAAGAEVPFIRPAELAQDESAVIDAVRHALLTMQSAGVAPFDTVALLEPTSPLRTADIVRRVVAAAEEPDADAALSVSPVPNRYHPLKQLVFGSDAIISRAVAGKQVVNRQGLGATYVRNGMCYAIRGSAAMTSFSMLGTRAKAVFVEGPVVNIDDAEDLALARRMLEIEMNGSDRTVAGEITQC